MLIAFSSYEAWVFALAAVALTLLLLALVLLVFSFKKPKSKKTKEKPRKDQQAVKNRGKKNRKEGAKEEPSYSSKDQARFASGGSFLTQKERVEKTPPRTVRAVFTGIDEEVKEASTPKPTIVEGEDVVMYDDRLSNSEEDDKFLETLQGIQKAGDEADEYESDYTIPDQTPEADEAWEKFARDDEGDTNYVIKEGESFVKKNLSKRITSTLREEPEDGETLGAPEPTKQREEVPNLPTPEAINKAPHLPIESLEPVSNTTQQPKELSEPPVAVQGTLTERQPDTTPTPERINSEEKQITETTFNILKKPKLNNEYHPVVGSIKFTEAKRAPVDKTTESALEEYRKIFGTTDAQDSPEEGFFKSARADLAHLEELLSYDDVSPETPLQHDYSLDNTEEHSAIFMFESDDFSNELDKNSN